MARSDRSWQGLAMDGHACYARITPWPAATKPWPALFCLLACVVVHGWWHKTGADFNVFYAAAQRLVTGTGQLYVASEAMPFKYAPPTQLLFAPLVTLPHQAARLVFGFLSAAAIVDVVRLGCWRLPSRAATWRSAFFAPLAILLPLVQELTLGQCDALLLWLMIRSEQLRRHRPWVASLLLAVACTIKPPLALVLVADALQGAYRRVAQACAVAMALALLHGCAMGPAQAWANWQAWRALLASTTEAASLLPDCQSLGGILARWGLSPQAHPRLHAAALVAAGASMLAQLRSVSTYTSLRACERRALMVAICLAWSAVLSPLGWIANFINLLPLVLWGMRSAADGPPGARIASPRRQLVWLPFAAAQLLNFELLGRARYTACLSAGHLGLAGLSSVCLAVWTWLPPRTAARARPRLFRCCKETIRGH